MKTRIITALVLIAVILPAVIVGNYAFLAVLLLLTIGAVYELLSICKHPESRIYLYPITYIYVACSVFYHSELLVPSLYIVLFLITLLVFSMFDSKLTLTRLCYIFTSSSLVAYGLHMILMLRNVFGLNYLILLALSTLGSDTFAYFVGKAIGKHKLNERLSPNKTIEGSIGGILIGGSLAVIYGLVFMQLPLYVLLIVSFVLSSTGQIGDLTFSNIKRTFSIKDYSNIFPGHGGILDRFDSIIFNAMIFGFLLEILV